MQIILESRLPKTFLTYKKYHNCQGDFFIHSLINLVFQDSLSLNIYLKNIFDGFIHIQDAKILLMWNFSLGNYFCENEYFWIQHIRTLLIFVEESLTRFKMNERPFWARSFGVSCIPDLELKWWLYVVWMTACHLVMVKFIFQWLLT